MLNGGKNSGTVLPFPLNNETSYFDESWSKEDLKQIIRKMNLKVTPQRLLILKTLHEGRVHITAQELFEKVQKINSDIGFATVYRFLKSMAESERHIFYVARRPMFVRRHWPGEHATELAVADLVFLLLTKL